MDNGHGYLLLEINTLVFWYTKNQSITPSTVPDTKHTLSKCNLNELVRNEASLILYA